MTPVPGDQHTIQNSRTLLGHELSPRTLTDGISENYFAYTQTGLVLPIVAGTLSFVSSSAIIVTILRSKQNTQYHRIMLVMSIFDAISSLFIALTTLPMPSEVNEGGSYHFQGIALGSAVTCELQAFLIFLGYGMCCVCNMFLNIYFFASIRYDVDEKKFRIFAEPIFLLFTSFAWVLPIHFLRVDMLNPSPYEPFCFYSTYPHDCGLPGGPDCIRGDKVAAQVTHDKFYLKYFLFFISSLIAILVLTMLGILWTVFFEKVEMDGVGGDIREGGRTNEAIQDSQNDPSTRTSEAFEENKTQIVGGGSIQKVSKYSQKEKNAMSIQALMYILACLLVWGSSVLSFFQTLGFGAFYVFFMPLQGFFNFLIFSGVKVYVATAVTKECSSIANALRTLFFSPDLLSDRSIIGNMDLVIDDTRENNEVEMSINISPLFPDPNNDVEDEDNVEDEMRNTSVIEDPFHCNIVGGEDLISAGTPSSVFPGSSRNDEDFSYMSNSWNNSTSLGAVSSSANTVKR